MGLSDQRRADASDRRPMCGRSLSAERCTLRTAGTRRSSAPPKRRTVPEWMDRRREVVSGLGCRRHRKACWRKDTVQSESGGRGRPPQLPGRCRTVRLRSKTQGLADAVSHGCREWRWYGVSHLPVLIEVRNLAGASANRADQNMSIGKTLKSRRFARGDIPRRRGVVERLPATNCGRRQGAVQTTELRRVLSGQVSQNVRWNIGRLGQP